MAVLVEWGDLAYKEYNGIEYYDHINMVTLFACSLVSLLLLRIGFAIVVGCESYKEGVSWVGCAFTVLLFLFPECVVFFGVVESHNASKYGGIKVSNFQLGAQLLEASIEAMPQVILVISFYFICNTTTQAWDDFCDFFDLKSCEFAKYTQSKRQKNYNDLYS